MISFLWAVFLCLPVFDLHSILFTIFFQLNYQLMNIRYKNLNERALEASHNGALLALYLGYCFMLDTPALSLFKHESQIVLFGHIKGNLAKA